MMENHDQRNASGEVNSSSDLVADRERLKSLAEVKHRLRKALSTTP
jgi:hypothetical protein